MFGINCLFVLSVFYKIEQINSLVTLPKVEDNNIIKAESIIRDTINSLFSNLGLKNVGDKQRLKQYSHVHNYFVSLTLQDYSSLKEIAKLTRVDKKEITNNAVDYIDLLNEILDEENVEALQSILIGVDLKTAYDLEEKLEYLKNFYNEGHRDENIDINKEVLRILQQEEALDLNVTTKAADSYTQLHDDNLLDDLPIWDKEEAQISGRRIYKGKRTKIKKFPFMASVQIFNKFQCGGSIIKSDLVITAASCLQLAWNNRFYRENPLFLSVRVGSSFYEIGGENIGVMEVYFHPAYNPKNLNHNVAVMRLIRKISLKKKNVKKIRLDTEEHQLPSNTEGVQILGWGAKTRSNILHGPWEDKLSFTTLRLYGLEDCQEIYSKEYVTHQHFCAGSVSVGSGACNRDVGDPGIVEGKLTGIVSFGSPVCGTPDAPTVFTKVGFYYDWIEDIMEQDVPSVMHRTTNSPPTYPYSPPDPGQTSRTHWVISPVSQDITRGLPFIILAENNLRGADKVVLPATNQLRAEDKELFKGFLKTMFDSAEAKKYSDKLSEPGADVKQNILLQQLAQQIAKQPLKQAVSQQPTVEEPQGPNLRVTAPIVDEETPSLNEASAESSLENNLSTVIIPCTTTDNVNDEDLDTVAIPPKPDMDTTVSPNLLMSEYFGTTEVSPDLPMIEYSDTTTLSSDMAMNEYLGTLSMSPDVAIDVNLGTTPVSPDIAINDYSSTSSVLPDSAINADLSTAPTRTPDLLDLVMDIDSSSDEEEDEKEESKEEDEKEKLPKAETSINLDPQQYAPSLPEKTKKNIPHHRSKLDNVNNKIDDSLSLFYLPKKYEIGKNRIRKQRDKNIEHPKNDARKFGSNETADIEYVDDLTSKQSSHSAEIRKLTDSDIFMEILNEEFVKGFKSYLFKNFTF